MKLNIRRFDVSRISPESIVLAVGKRKTGKSTVLRDIMYHMRHKLDAGFAFAGSVDGAENFRYALPDSCIYDRYRDDLLPQLIGHCKYLRDAGHERHVMIAMDDCMYDKKVLKGTAMRELFMNGRHYKLFFLNSVQYLMDMGPDLRSQVDYVFVLKENIISRREKLWKEFFGMFKDYKSFSQVMDSCTNNYECLVLDATSTTNNISDSVFWYKADPNIPKFTLGRKIMWKMHYKHYLPMQERLQRQKQKEEVAKQKKEKQNDKIETVEKRGVHNEVLGQSKAKSKPTSGFQRAKRSAIIANQKKMSHVPIHVKL